MTVDVKVPQLAESISDATLLEWKKEPGDAVEQDEILIELETDKVVLEIPAPESGVLKEIVRQNGETVHSNDVIARVEPGAAGRKKEERKEEKAAKEEQGDEQETAAKGAQKEAREPAAESAAGKLSPAVRKLVEEHDLDPAEIPGSGKGGRLTKGDVLAWLEKQDEEEKQEKEGDEPAREDRAGGGAPAARREEAPARAPAGERSERRVPMTRIRARIAERLVQAQQTAAILTTFNEVDMKPVMELRSRHKERFEKTHGVRLGFMSFFAKAAVQGLRRFPEVNAYIEGTEIVYHDYYDIGIAVGSPRGLIVPVLRDVERLSFADIEQQINDFAERAQKGQVSIEEMSGGTFTISNGGVFGSLLSTPILNPPQSGILGMHKTQERPVAVNGEMVIRPMMYLAFSYDHRIIDGREAVRFLITIKEALEDPGRMLLDL